MWLGHHFQGQKVKGQGHQAALLSAALRRKAAAAVSMGTYSAWESTAALRLLGGARGAWAPRWGEGRGHIVSRRAQLVVYIGSRWNVQCTMFRFSGLSRWKMTDLRKMGISWDEVEEAAVDRKRWWSRVAQCVSDVGWIRSQVPGGNWCQNFENLTMWPWSWPFEPKINIFDAVSRTTTLAGFKSFWSVVFVLSY